MRSLSVTVYDSCILSGHSMQKFNVIVCIDPFSVPSSTGIKRWDALLAVEWSRIRYAATSMIGIGLLITGFTSRLGDHPVLGTGLEVRSVVKANRSRLPPP